MTALRGLLMVAVAILASCDHLPSASYSGFVGIDDGGIPRDWVFAFDTAQDSTRSVAGVHDVIIAVRYSPECRAESITLDIGEMSPGMTEPDSMKVTIPLFSESGRPLGKGVYGIYEVTDTIHRRSRIQEGYVMTVSSPAPAEATEGVKAIGMILSR